MKEKSEPVSGVAAPTGGDHYVIPETVKEDEVAAFASEEDLLIYSHFYDKGKDKAEGELAALKALLADVKENWLDVSQGRTTCNYDVLDRVNAALGEKTA